MAARRTVEADWRGAVEMLLDGDGRLFCDSPDGCDVCMLFGPDTTEWRERVRQAFDAATGIQGPRPDRSRGLTPADRRLLAVMTPNYQNATQIAWQIGIHVLSVGKAVSDARKRGALIESRKNRGYRLRQEQSA